MSSGGLLRKKLAGHNGGLTNEQKRQDAFSKIDDLNRKLDKVFEFLNGKADNIARAAAALTALVGAEKVAEEMTRQEAERLDNEAAQVEVQLNAAIAAGALGVADTATNEGDVVVTSEKGADGTQRHPTKLFVRLKDYQEEARTLLTGKKVGDTITLADGGTLEVLAIYCEKEPVQAAEVVATSGLVEAPQAEVQ